MGIELSYRRATIPLVVGILLSLLFARLVWGWTNPTQAPPNGNVSLPSAQWTASGTAIYNSNSGNVGIGITNPGQKFSVAGTIESTSGGFKFPDGTTQTSAADYSARVYNTAGFSLPNDTNVVMTFDSERWDNGSVHSTSTNTSRLTAPSTGTYLIIGQAQFSNSATSGPRILSVRINGTSYVARQALYTTVSDDADVIVPTIWQLNTGDYAELVAWQRTGGTMSIEATPPDSPEFTMKKLF